MSEKGTSNESIKKIMALVLICFFFSGMTGLIYEILWTRMIVKLIGSAPFAISIILTVFMGGLGLGSYLASRTIDRIRNPLDLVKIYGALELIIAAYGLVLPLLIIAFKPLYSIVYNQLFNHFMLYNLLTFLGCAVLLIIPVICMGATLPILCRFYVSSLSHLGTHTGRLYGLNTIGAAAGSLLCGFWLIHALGVWGTLIFAILINTIIGILCLYAGYRTDRFSISEDKTAEPSPEPAEEEKSVKEASGILTGSLVIFAVSGFCSMAYEVIWAKLLGLIVGPTTYSFTIVLVTFILGLALGSLFFGWLSDRIGKTIWILLITQVIAALFALGISQLLGNSQMFFGKLIYHFQDQFALRSFLKALVLFIIMIVPTLCLGATFPLVGKIYTRSVSKVGRSIGFAYAINTIGAVLGSFSAGFILIPLLGKENGLSLVVGFQLLTSLTVACVIIIRMRKRLIRVIPLAVPALIGLILCGYFPEWNHSQLSIGKYHRFNDMGEIDLRGYNWLESLLNGPEILSGAEYRELLFYGDGIGGFTTVLKTGDPLGGDSYVLANSGKPDASSKGDMKTQTLSAHFPMLFHKDPKKVMVLGLASGVTSGEALYYPIEQLDVIDINEQVVRASDYFIPWNNDVLKDPRTNLIIQDGRAHLNLSNEKYDVIISEPSNPWMAGLASLFTEDFFKLGFDRLEQGGIFVQFIHTYQMDWDTFALVGRTFSQAFPDSLLVVTSMVEGGGDYLLIGFKGMTRLDLEAATKNIVYARRSPNIRLADPRLLYRLIVSEDLERLFGDGPINTDSNPILEYRAPKLIYDNSLGNMMAEYMGDRIWKSPETVSIVRQVTSDVDAQIDFAEYAFSIYTPFPKMFDPSMADMAQEKRFMDLFDEYCSKTAVQDMEIQDNILMRRCRTIQAEILSRKLDQASEKTSIYEYLGHLYYNLDMLDRSIASYRQSLQIDPENAKTHFNTSSAYGKSGNMEQAIFHLKESLRLGVDSQNIRKNLGYALGRQGRLDESIEEYREALTMIPEDINVLNSLGIVLYRKGDIEGALDHIQKAMEIKPGEVLSYTNMARIMVNTGDLEGALKAYRKTVRLAPNDLNVLNEFAVFLATQGMIVEAVEYFNKVLKIKPDIPDVNLNIGRLMLRKGRIDEAISYYMTELKINPDSPDAHADLGRILNSRGRTDDAIKHLEEALKINPDMTDVRKYLNGISASRTE